LPAGKCNCSICAKTRDWGAIIKPGAFKLLAGEEALRDYQFGARQGHHFFCGTCGVQVFGRGDVLAIGGEYVSVRLSTLDGTDVELAEAPVKYFNGRDNSWWTPPAETRHL
jgi:hypothetical protein